MNFQRKINSMSDITSFIENYQRKLIYDINCMKVYGLEKVVQIIEEAIKDRTKIYICGNGGSASTAQHFATDLYKGCGANALSLADNMALITAISNDYAYDRIFAEQLGKEEKAILIAISGSGNSPNVIAAVDLANAKNWITIGITQSTIEHAYGRVENKLLNKCNHCLTVDDEHMGRIEDSALIFTHMICYYFMEKQKAN